ncbi:MAG: hypothetical protein HUU08_06300 [Candidatus Brocadia sp.]|nr:hypothetical protein [Candidatus Brocadia sp.]
MKKSIVISSLFLACLILTSNVTLAQKPQTFQYAVKFICGKSTGEVVAKGMYFTAINVHNPNNTEVKFQKKFAIAMPMEKPGPVSKFFDAKLGPDEALEIDNRDIFEHTRTAAGFVKGFVVIESDAELDVVAVYTAAGKTNQVETLHIERISPRTLEHPSTVCVDFESPLVAGTQYGVPAGNSSGDVVFTAHGIPVSVYNFDFAGGGGTFKVARVETAPVPFGSGQSIRTNNINLEFDFSQLNFQPSEVQLEFLDLGGHENISVNGSPVFAGELSSVPNPIGGVSIAVNTVTAQGSKKGIVTLTGAVKNLRIGGQEFWIDNVCVKK